MSFDYRTLLALAVLATVCFCLLNAALPVMPIETADSDAYVQFSAMRPHGYSWFLAAYRSFVREDLAYLPSVQLAAYISSLFLLASAVGCRTGSFPAAATVLMLACLCTRTSEAEGLMSDTLYAAAVISGTALLVLHVARPNGMFIALSATGVGFAIAFRTIGYALVLPLLIAVALHAFVSGFSTLRALLVAAVPMAAVYSALATSQYIRYGEFGIGSAGGTSLLGKGLVLARPLSDTSSLPALNGLADAAVSVRSAMHRIDHPFLKTLVLRQYHEYLRWFVALPELTKEWPAWRQASEAERSRLSGRLAFAYIGQDPAGYVWQVAIDLLGLWTMPRWLIEPELARLQDKLDRLGDLPFLTEFSRTPEGQLEFYQILPSGPQPLRAVLLRTSSGVFWVFSIWLFFALVRRPAWFNIWRSPDLLFIALAVHSVYIVTALAESAHERYLIPTWPLLVVGPILAMAIATGRSRDRVLHRRQRTRDPKLAENALHPSNDLIEDR